MGTIVDVWVKDFCGEKDRKGDCEFLISVLCLPIHTALSDTA